MNKDLIIFDCDGTLVDTEDINNCATARVLAEEGLTQYDQDYAMQNFVGLRFNEVLRHIAEETGYIFPDNMAQRYVSLARQMVRENLVKIDGAIELVAAASAQRSVCVASNGQRDNVIGSLVAAELKPYFKDEHIFTAIEVERAKPHPDLFLHAALRMGGYAPHQCVVIEDSPVGVMAGLAAGMSVIGFTGAHADSQKARHLLQQAGATHIFDCLTALRGALGL